MSVPDLKDPRKLFHEHKFPQQEQDTPAVQDEMKVKPDCGEESYVGHQKLAGRRVLITGGDSGIGRAAAIAYAREGAHVAIQYLPGEDEDAKEVAALIEAAGQKSLLLPYDLRDEAAPQAMVEKTVAAFDGLDTVVLNAAQQIAQPSLADLSMQQVKDSFMINIISMYAIVKEAVPHMPAGSSIITTTSVQGYQPSPQLLDYAATKAAIANFTENLAQSLIEKGIRVNGVAPGPIWTPLQIDGGQLPDAIPEFGQESLMERAGQPVELAPVYVFLVSNDASYVTAQIYGVTGGTIIN